MTAQLALNNVPRVRVSQPELQSPPAAAPPVGDDLLAPDDLVPVRREAAVRTESLALAELAELIRQNRWAEAVDLFHPVEEKLPELADHGRDIRVREKIAFALGHLGRQRTGTRVCNSVKFTTNYSQFAVMAMIGTPPGDRAAPRRKSH